jgi:hypothetical protein
MLVAKQHSSAAIAIAAVAGSMHRCDQIGMGVVQQKLAEDRKVRALLT